jgi:hypothetical protein
MGWFEPEELEELEPMLLQSQLNPPSLDIKTLVEEEEEEERSPTPTHIPLP